MNIPQTTVEPFNTMGIPALMPSVDVRYKFIRKAVMDILLVLDRSALDTKDVNLIKEIARQRGAHDPRVVIGCGVEWEDGIYLTFCFPENEERWYRFKIIE